MRQAMRTRSRFARATPLPSRPGDYRNRGRDWKRLGPIMVIGTAVFVFIAVLVYLSVSYGSSHPAVGKWRAGLLVLRVDPDKVAIVNGVVCSWRRVDDSTIRIRPPMKVGDPEFGTIEVAFELTVKAGGQQAVAEVFGFPMTLDRDRTGQ